MKLVKTLQDNQNNKVEIYASITEHDKSYKNDLMNIWLKNKWLNKFIDKNWSIEVCCYDNDGNCWAWYNPTHKLSDDKRRLVVNFDYMLEATNDNLNKIIDGVSDMIKNNIKILA